jgi:hypothetical protein
MSFFDRSEADMRGLTNGELEVLKMLESGVAIQEGRGAGKTLVSKRLFEYGLLGRKASGELTLTAAGNKLLFRMHCAAALRARNVPGSPAMRAWLLDAGFVELGDDGGEVEVTARGLMWLDALDETSMLFGAGDGGAALAGDRRPP